MWKPLVWAPTTGFSSIDDDSKGETLKIVTYNLLCDGTYYSLSGRHNYCRHKFLDWSTHRGPLVVRQLRAFDADVICLQEVNQGMLTDLLDCLSKDGYILAGSRMKRDAMWQRRNPSTGSPMGVATLVKSETVLVDGVDSIIFRDALQDISSQSWLSSVKAEAIRMTRSRNDCVVMSKLRRRGCPSMRVLCGNIHTYWNPQPKGVKPLQVFLAYRSLLAYGRKSPAYPASQICIAGDLNSDTFSESQSDGALVFLSKGYLPPTHIEYPGQYRNDRELLSTLGEGGTPLKSAHEDLFRRLGIEAHTPFGSASAAAPAAAPITEVVDSSGSTRLDEFGRGGTASTLSSNSPEFSPAKPQVDRSKHLSSKITYEKLATNVTPTYRGWLSHIFVGSDLDVSGLLTLPFDPSKPGEATKFGPIPSEFFPSDHVPLGAIVCAKKPRSSSYGSSSMSDFSLSPRYGVRSSPRSSIDDDGDVAMPSLVRNEGVSGSLRAATASSLATMSGGNERTTRLALDIVSSPSLRNRSISAPLPGSERLDPEEIWKKLQNRSLTPRTRQMMDLFRRAMGAKESGD
eukprot:g318.t1